MTLVQLRHFICLADAGSFSKAAEQAFVTQPALSRSIQALEETLGVRLVDRVGRRVELTPMGRQTLARARQLVSDATELVDGAQQQGRGDAATLSIGMGSGPAVLLMTRLLLEVARLRPRWRVEVARGATELLVQRLHSRTLDALVVDLRSLVPSPDLRVELAVELPGAFMVRPGHPLARQRAVTFEAVMAYPLASSPLSVEVSRGLVALYGPRAHPEHGVGVRCEDIASLVSVAEHSDAVLLAIRASAPGLVALEMAPPMALSARLGVVTLARRTLPPAMAVVREMIGRWLAESAAPAQQAALATRARPPKAPRPVKAAR
ncbi:MAG: LysR family transcriptional regulator [Rubrivivax sp.]|jgi:DNA-binding transcriptional LysR family regulator|nr:LysR family transcriptional regulator [Rubrivivax sp.]